MTEFLKELEELGYGETTQNLLLFAEVWGGSIGLIATVIGIAGGLFTFWRFARDTRNARRAEKDARKKEEDRRWRETFGYMLFHDAIAKQDVSNWISTNEFISRMKELGWDSLMNKKDMTDEDLFLLLASMVSKGLIEPVGAHAYMLRVETRNLEELGIYSDIKEPHAIIIDLIRVNAGELTEAALAEELQKAANIDLRQRPFRLREILRQLMDAELVRFNEAGRLELVHEEDWAAEKFEERQQKR